MSASSSESVKPSMAAHLSMSTYPEYELAASWAAMAALGGFTTLQHELSRLRTTSPPSLKAQQCASLSSTKLADLVSALPHGMRNHIDVCCSNAALCLATTQRMAGVDIIWGVAYLSMFAAAASPAAAVPPLLLLQMALRKFACTLVGLLTATTACTGKRASGQMPPPRRIIDCSNRSARRCHLRRLQRSEAGEAHCRLSNCRVGDRGGSA